MGKCTMCSVGVLSARTAWLRALVKGSSTVRTNFLVDPNVAPATLTLVMMNQIAHLPNAQNLQNQVCYIHFD